MDFKMLAYGFLLKADKGCHWVLARHIITLTNNAVSLQSGKWYQNSTPGVLLLQALI